jgi:hypothetical protein
MFDDIIEGECNGRNYYDSEPWNHEDDSNCPGPSSKSNRPTSREFIWFSSGKGYRLSELTDKHLDNSITFCNKWGKTKELWHLCKEKERRLQLEKLQAYEEMIRGCQFCGKPMIVGHYHVNEEGYTNTEVRLLCECGAMGPVIETHMYQCI